MPTEAATHLLTAEEFFQLPEPIHGGKMELVQGEVVTHMPVGGVHGKLAGRIVRRVAEFAGQHGLGEAGPEIGFVLARNPDDVLAPDVAFIANDRLAGGALPESFVEGPPTLAVEVVSPNDRDTDVNEKVLRYLRAGTERVWVVRPRGETVTVYHADGTARIYREEQTLTSDEAGFVVAGFELPLDQLFG